MWGKARWKSSNINILNIFCSVGFLGYLDTWIRNFPQHQPKNATIFTQTHYPLLLHPGISHFWRQIFTVSLPLPFYEGKRKIVKLAPTTFGPPPPFAVMRRGEVPFVSSAALDSKQTHTHAGFPNKQSELRERPFKRASPSSTTKYVVLSGSIPTPPIFQIALKGGRRRRIPQNTPPHPFFFRNNNEEEGVPPQDGATIVGEK